MYGRPKAKMLAPALAPLTPGGAAQWAGEAAPRLDRNHAGAGARAPAPARVADRLGSAAGGPLPAPVARVVRGSRRVRAVPARTRLHRAGARRLADAGSARAGRVQHGRRED